MKSIRGALFVFILLATSAILWYFATPTNSIGYYEQIGYMIGGVAITGFALTFLLSIRSSKLDRIFNGLGNIYFYHKALAAFSIVLTYLHGIVQGLDDRTELTSNIAHLAGGVGGISKNLFIFLILVAFFARFLKYEHWRYIHRLMLIPFVIGLAHIYFTGVYDLFALTPLSIFTGIIAVIGIASGIYMLIIYQNVQFKYKGKITGIHRVSVNAVELELTLNKKMDYKAGQFIFLKFFQPGFEQAPHPFSISGGDGKKIYVTIKASGDFTRQVNHSIQLNTVVAVEGPYGHMDFESGKGQQIWVAGGVGIAPFLSYLRYKPLQRDVELFYSYRGREGAIYKDYLESYAKNNEHLKIKFIDTTIDQRLNFESYVLQNDMSIFMCGPKKMIEGFNRQFRSKKTNVEITFEAFNFR